jgi:uncharacterized Zn finger protein (UPF0148 family)
MSSEGTQIGGIAQPKVTARVAQRRTGAKTGEYVCQKCQTQFKYTTGQLKCPKCGTGIADDLIPFYTEDGPEKEGLSTDEFHGGD